MKKALKKLMPQTVAPVQRETSATVSRDGSAIVITAIIDDFDLIRFRSW